MVMAPRPMRETFRSPRCACFTVSAPLVAWCVRPARWAWPEVVSGVVVGEVAGQAAVGIDLGEQGPGLLLHPGDGVRSGDPAHRRLVGSGGYQRSWTRP